MIKIFSFCVLAVFLTACSGSIGGASNDENMLSERMERLISRASLEGDIEPMLESESYELEIIKIGERQTFLPRQNGVGLKVISQDVLPFSAQITIIKATNLSCYAHVLGEAEQSFCDAAKSAQGSSSMEPGTQFTVELEQVENETESGTLVGLTASGETGRRAD